MRCPVCVRHTCTCAPGDWRRVVGASFNAAAYWAQRDREGYGTERPVIDGENSRDEPSMSLSPENRALLESLSPAFAGVTEGHRIELGLSEISRLLDAARQEGARGGEPVAWRAALQKRADAWAKAPDSANLIVNLGDLRQALASPAEPSGWRPIESAPKDGTVIDVWREENGRDTVYWGFPPHECGEMGGLCDSEWHSIRAPGWVCSTFGEFLGRKHAPFTHWRPLPLPPTSEGGEA